MEEEPTWRSAVLRFLRFLRRPSTATTLLTVAAAVYFARRRLSASAAVAPAPQVSLRATIAAVRRGAEVVVEPGTTYDVWRFVHDGTPVTSTVLHSFMPLLAGLLASAAPPRLAVALPPARSSLPTIFLLLAPVAYMGLLYVAIQRAQNPPDAKVGRSASSSSSWTTTFDQVAGVDDAKVEVLECVQFLRDPTAFTDMGATFPRGVLLYGPSGTGKTLLARAVAGEAGVPFLFCSASEFVEVLVGRGASRIREVFKRARACAPSVLFIDEIDSLAKARGGPHSHDEREQALCQLLTAMDGVDTSSTSVRSSAVLVIGATNRVSSLDAALLRPGRFDRIVHVPPPTTSGRRAILDVHVQRLKHLAADVRLDAYALAMTNFTGADIANVVNEAALLALRRGLPSVTDTCFRDAIRKRFVAQRAGGFT